MEQIIRLFSEEDGQGMVEYTLILALFVILGLIGLTSFGEGFGDYIKNVGSKISNAL